MRRREAQGFPPVQAGAGAVLGVPAGIAAAQYLHELGGLGDHGDGGEQGGEQDLQRRTGQQAGGATEGSGLAGGDEGASAISLGASRMARVAANMNSARSGSTTGHCGNSVWVAGK